MAPILAYPDFTKPFKFHTDACGTGLGAVIYHTQEDGTEAVIAYASRSFRKAESNYPAHKLEFLALKWAVVKKFYKYLSGLTFDVYTDNNPLTYVLTTTKLDATSHCWVASLANYNFWLHYWTGKTNIDTDALLRLSWQPQQCKLYMRLPLKGPISPIEAHSCDLHILDAVQDSQHITCMTLEDWHQAQQLDPTLSLVITILQGGTLGKGQSKATDLPEVSQNRWEHNHLLLKQGILYRWARPRESEETLLQLVLPAAQREVALRGCHDEVGHLGMEHMLDLMHDRFFWSHMAAQVREHIGNCCMCLAFKARQPKAPLKTS